MTTITITMPAFVPYLLGAIIGSLIWFFLADRLIGRLVWEKLARREGNIVLESRWFWPALICDGPVAWAMAASEGKRLHRQRKSSWKRRHDPETRAKIQENIRRNSQAHSF